MQLEESGLVMRSPHLKKHRCHQRAESSGGVAETIMLYTSFKFWCRSYQESILGIELIDGKNKKPIKGMELTKAKSILGIELTDEKSKKPIMGIELTEIKPIVGIKLRNK